MGLLSSVTACTIAPGRVEAIDGGITLCPRLARKHLRRVEEALAALPLDQHAEVDQVRRRMFDPQLRQPSKQVVGGRGRHDAGCGGD